VRPLILSPAGSKEGKGEEESGEPALDRVRLRVLFSAGFKEGKDKDEDKDRDGDEDRDRDGDGDRDRDEEGGKEEGRYRWARKSVFPCKLSTRGGSLSAKEPGPESECMENRSMC
jgi:hypothetical protein